jgi:uncharacterized membrane protein
MNKNRRSKWKKYDVEWWTGHVLRFGVLISAAFMIAGLIAAAFSPQPVMEFAANPSLGNLAKTILSGNINSVILMFVGLVLLMFTPIMRVIAALFGFAAEKDRRFVIVSTTVFVLLICEIIYSLSIK